MYFVLWSKNLKAIYQTLEVKQVSRFYDVIFLFYNCQKIQLPIPPNSDKFEFII